VVLFAAVHVSLPYPKAKPAHVRLHVGYWGAKRNRYMWDHLSLFVTHLGVIQPRWGVCILKRHAQTACHLISACHCDSFRGRAVAASGKSAQARAEKREQCMGRHWAW
jgi:hypothetical protein